MPAPDLFLGIASVGSQPSAALVASATGQLLGAARAAPIALQRITYHELLLRLNSLLEALSASAGITTTSLLSRTHTLSLGVSGGRFPYERETVVPRLLTDVGLANCVVRLQSDAEVIFRSQFPEPRGLVLILDENSITFARNSHASAHAGGWGPIVGDHGAYPLGRYALATVARACDRDENADSLLWSEVHDALRMDDAWQELSAICPDHDPRLLLPTFISGVMLSNRRWRRIIAGLAPAIIRAWENDDTLANIVVDDLLARIERQAKSLCHRVALDIESIHTVAYGSLVIPQSPLSDAIRRRLGLEPTSFVVSSLARPIHPEIGALLSALHGTEASDRDAELRHAVEVRLHGTSISTNRV